MLLAAGWILFGATTTLAWQLIWRGWQSVMVLARLRPATLHIKTSMPRLRGTNNASWLAGGGVFVIMSQLKINVANAYAGSH